MVAGASSIERIRIMLELANARFNKSLDSTRRKMRQTGAAMNQFGSVMTMSLDNWRAANRAASMTVPEFQKFAKAMPTNQLKDFNLRMYESGQFTNASTGQFINAAQAQQMMGSRIKTSGGKVANATRDMTHGMRGFRMEMLGVMFFGMMLQQVFLGFLHPVMEAFGVFDLFRVMLLTLFLPIMEMMFPTLLKIMEWFMELPDKSKTVIGVLTVIGVVLGGLLFILGAFALGIGSIIQVLGMATPYLGMFKVAILGISTTFLLIAGIVIALLAAMYIAWKENFMGMRDIVRSVFNGIKDIISGVLDIVLGIVQFFIAIIKGDFEGMKQALEKIMKGIYKLVKGIFNLILGFIAMIIVAIVRILYGIVKILWDFGASIGKSLAKTFSGITKDMKQWGKDMIQGLADGISTMASAVKESLLGLFPQWARDLIWSAGTFTIKVLSGIKGAITGGGLPHRDDFIWRSGQGAVSINPNDTLVGFKGAAPNMGGSGEATINNYFNGFTMEDLKRELDDRDRRIVDDIRRIVKA